MNRQEILKQIQQWPSWDATAQQQYQLQGVPPAGLLQNPQELADLCFWIAAHQIRSLLEIGIWTAGSRRLWQELQGGYKQEIVYPPVAAGIPWMGWGIWSARP